MNLESLWNAPVQSFWVPVTWTMLVALWSLHILLRIIHVWVSWPDERGWKVWWVLCCIIATAYFLAQVNLANPALIPFWLLARNLVGLLLIVTLLIDVSMGIRGTAARRVRRAQEQRQGDNRDYR